MKRALLILTFVAACGRPPIIETPNPVQQQQNPLEGCDGAAVVALQGRTLERLAVDGSTQVLFTFGDGMTDEQVNVMQWNAKGGYIAGIAFLLTEPMQTYELVLLKSDGTQAFHRRWQAEFNPSVYFGADGTVAVEDANGGWLAKSDGSVTPLADDVRPMTAPLAGGAFMAAKGRSWVEGSVKGVWKGGVFTPLAVQPGYLDVQVVGERAVFVAGAELVSPLDGRRVTLPMADARLVSSAAGRYVLLTGETLGAWVDLELGTVKPVTMPTPRDRYSVWDVGVANDGALLASTEQNGMLQLQRSSDLGASWSPVGAPLAMGMDYGLGRWLLPVERSGTVMTLSMSTGYGHYVNVVQVTSSHGTHSLDTGGIYVNADIAPGAVDLSADGQCAAAWSQVGEQQVELTFLDFDGKKTVAHRGSAAGWLKFLP